MPQTAPPPSRLPTFGEDGHVNLVLETPKGSPNKYAYSEPFGTFQFKLVLPECTSFPYDFGMVPPTKGADGDPLDILIPPDAPAFPGCVLEARLVGVIEVEQCERNESWERNDRLIGVAVKPPPTLMSTRATTFARACWMRSRRSSATATSSLARTLRCSGAAMPRPRSH